MTTYPFYGGIAHGRQHNVRHGDIVRLVYKDEFGWREDVYKRVEHQHWDGSVEFIFVCIERESIVH